MNAILIAFHCKSNAGYAINALLPTFIRMAKILVHSEQNIHISFTKLNGFTKKIDTNDNLKIIEFDPSTKNKAKLTLIREYIIHNQIDIVFGFDQPINQPSYKYLRKGGIKKIISYWGAPMSGPNTGIKLKLKQFEVFCTQNKPDYYIFESKVMARSATHGRGIPDKCVSVVHLGVDIEKFKPALAQNFYAHDKFNIPRNRKIIYYSGHMEKRKGVSILIKAAQHLYDLLGVRNYHFLILGNQEGQEIPFLNSISNPDVKSHVTFGGYRHDVHKIIPCCYLGAIASTGWDSFTMSSVEMSSCGLPLIVSDLQGLAETIEHGRTGFLFPVGDYIELASLIEKLISGPELRDEMSNNSRERIVKNFTIPIQVSRLVDIVKTISSS